MSQKYNFILLDAQNSSAKKLTPLNLKLRLTAVNYFRKKNFRHKIFDWLLHTSLCLVEQWGRKADTAY